MKTKLTILYYSTFAIYLLVIVLLGMVIKFTPYEPSTQVGMVIQYGVIGYLMISVPGALFFFKKYMKKVCKIEDEKAREKAYFIAALVRLTAISAGVVFALAAFYLLGQNVLHQASAGSYSMLWCAAISLISQVFCKPNATKIYLEMNDIREDDPRAGDAQ